MHMVLYVSIVSLSRVAMSSYLVRLAMGVCVCSIPDCTLNGQVFECPLPDGAEVCGAACA
jgi:hypothetical protein